MLRALKTSPKMMSISAPEAVGERAANHAAEHAEQREHAPATMPASSHADVEFLGDVEGEEREEHCPADAVDETDADHDPEQARIIVVEFSEVISESD